MQSTQVTHALTENYNYYAHIYSTNTDKVQLKLLSIIFLLLKKIQMSVELSLKLQYKEFSTF